MLIFWYCFEPRYDSIDERVDARTYIICSPLATENRENWVEEFWLYTIVSI